MKIVIYKNPNGDTRTAPSNVSFEEFQKANDMHREDVKKVMEKISYKIKVQGTIHDWTKKSKEEMFYKDFLNAKNNNTDFVKSDWYKYHVQTEKHHPLSDCHNDITLLDITEMIVDCVCAGLTGSGEVNDIKIPNDILNKAIDNTVNMIKEMVYVK